MNPDNYVYPDREETLTSRLIKSYNEERWNIEEAYVLERTRKSIRLMEKLGTSLDVGTGLGRLIQFLLSISKRVIAIDADLWRLKRAMAVFSSNPGVFFLWSKGSRLDPIPPESVDFINYSHVAQHVPHYELIETLGEFYRVLKKGGHVLFLTTHSEDREWFLVSSEEGAEAITRDEYEELTRNPRPGKLPVRKFNIDSLENLLRECGFEIEWKIYYHIKPEFVPSGSEISATEVVKMLKSININEENARKKALDVALLLRKG